MIGSNCVTPLPSSEELDMSESSHSASLLRASGHPMGVKTWLYSIFTFLYVLVYLYTSVAVAVRTVLSAFCVTDSIISHLTPDIFWVRNWLILFSSLLASHQRKGLDSKESVVNRQDVLAQNIFSSEDSFNPGILIRIFFHRTKSSLVWTLHGIDVSVVTGLDSI